MQREFELETILSVTTGIMCVDNIDRICDLAKFIYHDTLVNHFCLSYMKEDMKEHIFTIHPRLSEVYYYAIPGYTVEQWIESQKQVFGNTLKISRKGQPLKQEGKTIKKVISSIEL